MFLIHKFFLTAFNSFISNVYTREVEFNCFLSYELYFSATTFYFSATTFYFSTLLFTFLHCFLSLIPSSIETQT